MVPPAVLAPIVCVLASGAAVLSFARGSWLGVVWLLLLFVFAVAYLRALRMG